MTQKKQTAVDFLWNKASNGEHLTPEDFEQAKAMHKEEIMKAAYDNMGNNFDPNMGRAEQYYNETFKQD